MPLPPVLRPRQEMNSGWYRATQQQQRGAFALAMAPLSRYERAQARKQKEHDDKRNRSPGLMLWLVTMTSSKMHEFGDENPDRKDTEGG